MATAIALDLEIMEYRPVPQPLQPPCSGALNGLQRSCYLFVLQLSCWRGQSTTSNSVISLQNEYISTPRAIKVLSLHS